MRLTTSIAGLPLRGDYETLPSGSMGLTVVLALLVLLPSIFAVSALHARRERRVHELWSSVARALGLKYLVTSRGRQLTGSIQGIRVEAEHRVGPSEPMAPIGGLFEPQRDRVSAEHTLITVGEGAGIPKSISLRADSQLRSLGRLVGGEDVKTGDALFDERVEVQGRRAEVLATLSQQARVKLRPFLLELGGKVREGKLIYEEPRGISSSERLESVIVGMVALARALSLGDAGLVEKLAANAIEDRNRRVREGNFQALREKCAGSPRLVGTARQLLRDPYPPLRLLAALEVPPGEAADTLSGLVADERVEPAVRADALTALMERAPGRCEVSAEAGLRDPHIEVRRAALEAAAEGRFVRLLPEIMRLASAEDAEMREAVAAALSRFADAETERLLIGLLGDASRRVQCAAARALGTRGSVLAVEPLLLHAKGLGSTELRQAARAAVGAIQSRLGDAEAGQLSLASADPLPGALSLAEVESEAAGGLSLSAEDGTNKGLRGR